MYPCQLNFVPCTEPSEKKIWFIKKIVLYLYKQNKMKPFQKTYYTDKFNITIRVKRDCFDSMGCRLTIKDRTKSFNGHLVRVLYTWFYNDKDMFRKLLRGMLDVKVSRKTIDEIIDDVKENLMVEEVIAVVYKKVTKKMFWE
jgi:hypothetical protein